MRTLATSAGAQIAASLRSARSSRSGDADRKGKLEEMRARGLVSADVILFDHDLSPSQQRNIKLCSHAVIDRNAS